MRFFGTVGLGAVVAGAGLALYVRRQSEQTGVGYATVIRRLVGDIPWLVDDARRRARLALEQGREAAHRRQDELTRELAAVSSAST
jgi:hypothetical protein